MYVILKFILLINYLWRKEEYITTVDMWIVIEILQWETWHIGEDHAFKIILSFERKVWNLIKNLWLSDIWFRVLNFGPKNEVINPYMVLQRELFLCCRVVTTFSLWLITMQQPSLSCTWHSLKSLQSHGSMVSYFMQWSIIFYTLYIVFFFSCVQYLIILRTIFYLKKKTQQFFVSSNNNIVYQTIDMFPFHF